MRALCSLSLLVVLACTSSTTETATSVVRRFYAATIAQKVTGAPTSAQLATLAPYISDTLRSLLDAARRRNEADAARTPDEKPAFADGDQPALSRACSRPAASAGRRSRRAPAAQVSREAGRQSRQPTTSAAQLPASEHRRARRAGGLRGYLPPVFFASASASRRRAPRRMPSIA